MVDYNILEFALDVHAVPIYALKGHAAFLHDSAGRVVALHVFGGKSVKTEHLKAELHDAFYRFGGKTLSPIGFSEHIPDFGGIGRVIKRGIAAGADEFPGFLVNKPPVVERTVGIFFLQNPDVPFGFLDRGMLRPSELFGYLRAL